LNDGQPLHPDAIKGRKLLLVNTASDCGYTAQYEALQQLADSFPKELLVIAFPANDFKNQEKADDATIAAFCKRNYGIRFPLAKKCQVIKGSGQHPVFAWLSQAQQNGWCDKAPEWNFSKYMVNEQGVLTHYFAPGISPLDEAVVAAIRQ
jgi:glutathione peroxidase